MSQPPRKPGDGGKVTDSLSPDDPSIPVLTERLTLPPLDLDLEFRLPPRPGQPTEPGTQPPEPRPMPIDEVTRFAPRDEATRYMPSDETRYAPAEDLPGPSGDETRYEPADETPFAAPEPPGHAAFDDEVTRIAPQSRRMFEPTHFPSVEGPPTRDPAGPSTVMPPAPAIDGPSVHGGTAIPVPDMRAGPPTVAPSPEPLDSTQRVPTSLLVSNLNTLLSTPTQTHRKPQPDDFDLTSTDPGRGISEIDDTELRERILLDLARRLPTEVDTIVRRHLETAIEEAVRRFTAEVRIALAGSLREIVDRAVKTELERLKARRE